MWYRVGPPREHPLLSQQGRKFRLREDDRQRVCHTQHTRINLLTGYAANIGSAIQPLKDAHRNRGLMIPLSPRAV